MRPPGITPPMLTDAEIMELVEKRVQRFNCYDDVYAKRFFQDRTIVEKAIRIILDNETLKMQKSGVQIREDNIGYHGVTFDVAATDSKGRRYIIEIQRRRTAFPPQRILYYQSSAVTHMLKSGTRNYRALPEIWTIVLFTGDPLGLALPKYCFQYSLEGNAEIKLGDGSHIVLVNGKNRDTGTRLGSFMKDLKSRDASKILDQDIKRRTMELKKGGEKEDMSGEEYAVRMDIYRDLRKYMGKKIREQERAYILEVERDRFIEETALNLFRNGVEKEVIASSLGISEERLDEILSA